MNKLKKLIQQKCSDGVEYRRISDICTITRGKVISKDYIRENIGDYPVYSSQTENDGELGRISTYDYEGEYLTWTTDGANAGTVFHRQGKFNVTNVCGLLKNRQSDVIGKYIYYALSIEAPKHVNQGMGNAKLMSNVIADIEIPVPPIEIQQEIVRALDKIVEVESELKVELNARKKQYEYYRDQLIDKVEGRNGKLIEMLCQPVTDGPHTTPKLVAEGIPFISATAIHEGRIHFEDAKGFITKEFNEECAKKYKPKRDDVYMVKSGSTTGKVGYVDVDADFNIWSPLAAMRVNSENSARYLFYLLQTQRIQHQVSTRMSHGSQPNLSMRVLEQFDVIIPTLQEQTKIANMLDRLDGLCYDNENGLPAEIKVRHKQYEYYREKLLAFKRKG